MDKIEFADNMVLLVVLSLIGIILFFNVIKIIINIFSSYFGEQIDPLRDEIRAEVNEKVRPHLHSLEVMHKNSKGPETTFGAFVFGLFKNKFTDYVEKDEQLVESEICKCCSEYEGAECKEEFCLDGSGISCNNEER